MLISSISKQGNRINESIQIVSIISNILPVDCDHIVRSHCVLIVNSDGAAVALQTEDSVLADLAIALSRTIGRIVVEKRIKPGAINRNAVGVDNSKTPTVRCRDSVAISLNSLLRELRVVKTSNEWEWKWGARVWLVICRLRLNLLRQS